MKKEFTAAEIMEYVTYKNDLPVPKEDTPDDIKPAVEDLCKMQNKASEDRTHKLKDAFFGKA